MRPHDKIPSEDDFEQLPAALQRKYFSSLERLRFAHDGSSPNSGCRPQSSKSRRPSSKNNIKTTVRSHSVPPAATSGRSFSFVSSSQRRTRLRKASRHLISPSTLLVNPWEFAALPAAIQRKHFSLEEQYHIASKINPVILDAADEALYKQHRQRIKGPHPQADREGEETGGEESDEEGKEDMDIKDLESLNWLDDENDLDLRLDDYHAISTELINRPPAISQRRRSFRRGLSFSNASFRRRSSSSISLHIHPPVGSDVNKTVPPPTPSLQVPKHQSRASTSSLDPSATHYQDPAAKMKLRVYLASPQKFDEALEFGFPSLHEDAVQTPARPKTSPGHVNGQPKTFFTDDTPSLSEDESPDEKSDYLRQDSPRTPIDMVFPGPRYSKKSSSDQSANVRPRIVRDMTASYAHASAADREMTLKMTLTRPELRALEDMNHSRSNQINERPLERAPLTVPVGQQRSIWEELPEEPSRMKRLFKKFRGRS